MKGAPFPASATAEGRPLNGAPFPATASAEGCQFNGSPSPLAGEGVQSLFSMSLPNHIDSS